ncbi:ribosomal protein S20 [Thermobaculum terrenum ATCC BAA-798]|uniref:Small ribosomal subunit protein bS20 n=1 Tax=Thermobaculum terrenum (strain ATCC BAA-798 / CCMEE 7001 / YNP1) TaxID=525904 RepID=D1CG08_THET1|nr:30S ribosomal protein S20 [Thermobaculum terrenum]ACZ41864.1 ribosomal protein S20 [Thermobaculum terrenum ATCC BAA-798]
MSRHHQRSLANKRSAEKAHRVSEKRRLRNKSIKNRVRTMISKVRRPLLAGDVATAEQNLAAAISALDRAVSKGVLHRNNAARRKSRLMKALAAARSSASS